MNYRIKNGRIVDGSGNESYIGDIVIRDGRIAPVDTPASEDEAVIDAAGLCVSPGFIDTHRHGDIAVFRDEDFGVLELAQGLTTIANGNCGQTAVPVTERSREDVYGYLAPALGESKGFNISGFGEYLDALEKRDLPINIAQFISTGTVTAAAKGFSAEPFTDETLKVAVDFINEALDAGAVGVSGGLFYPPDCFTDYKSLVAMIKCAGKKGRHFTCHVREEGLYLVSSIKEVVKIAEEAGASLNISHFSFKAMGNGGRRSSLIGNAIDLIEDARKRGMDVTVDFYPYIFNATTLMSILPPAILEKGQSEAVKLLKTEEGVKLLLDAVKNPPEGWHDHSHSFGWDGIYLSSVITEKNRDIESKNIQEIAKIRGVDNEWVLVAQIIAEEDGMAGINEFCVAEEDMERIAMLDYSMLVSDSLYSGARKPHPRLYGTFPRMIRHFVREKKLMSLELAIKKMTSMPAKRLKLKDRGLLKEGYYADICIFDPETISDVATFDNPCRLATGMKYVFVNGEIAWADNAVTGSKSGMALRMAEC